MCTDLLIEPIDDLRLSVDCRAGIEGRPLMGPNDCLPDMDMRDIGSVWLGRTRGTEWESREQVWP